MAGHGRAHVADTDETYFPDGHVSSRVLYQTAPLAVIGQIASTRSFLMQM
jgi:hypothetical protein